MLLGAAPDALAQQNAALRQQLQHYQYAAQQQQARMFGMCEMAYIGQGLGTAFGDVDVLTVADFNANYAPGQALHAWGRQVYVPPDPEAAAKQQAAQQRALDLLEQKIGSAALGKIQAGGAYTVPSKWWPTVHYLVPHTAAERVKVVADGSVVTEVCIVTTDPSLPWPDTMLQRISAIEMDESILFQTGVIHDFRKRGWRDKLKRLFK